MCPQGTGAGGLSASMGVVLAHGQQPSGGPLQARSSTGVHTLCLFTCGLPDKFRSRQ